MREYMKPMLVTSDELAEGVYLASGAGCYTASAYIHQTPQDGRGPRSRRKRRRILLRPRRSRSQRQRFRHSRPILM